MLNMFIDVYIVPMVVDPQCQELVEHSLTVLTVGCQLKIIWKDIFEDQLFGVEKKCFLRISVLD